MSNIYHRNNIGALYYLNIINEEAPVELKNEIEIACTYIQREIDSFVVAKNNKTTLNYRPESLTEEELIRITMVTLNNIAVVRKINLINLIKYVRRIRVKKIGESRK